MNSPNLLFATIFWKSELKKIILQMKNQKEEELLYLYERLFPEKII